MNCPKCNSDLNGKDIYQEFLNQGYDEQKAADYASQYGWSPENLKCFRREIGVEFPEYYDGIIIWLCPDCNYAWKRFDWVDDKYLETYGKV